MTDTAAEVARLTEAANALSRDIAAGAVDGQPGAVLLLDGAYRAYMQAAKDMQARLDAANVHPGPDCYCDACNMTDGAVIR